MTLDSDPVTNAPDLGSITIDNESWNIPQGNRPQLSDFTEGTGIDITSVNNTISIAVDQTVIPTKTELSTGLATKQDVISDLATIRSGAAAGATAVQPADLSSALASYVETSDLATVATTGDYDDLIDKPTIPPAVSGTNDGTNWTSLTIGSDTYGLASGGGSVSIDQKTIITNGQGQLETAIGGYSEIVSDNVSSQPMLWGTYGSYQEYAASISAGTLTQEQVTADNNTWMAAYASNGWVVGDTVDINLYVKATANDEWTSYPGTMKVKGTTYPRFDNVVVPALNISSGDFRIQSGNGQEFISVGSQITDINYVKVEAVLGSSTIYHPIDARYIAVDNSTIKNNSGVLEAEPHFRVISGGGTAKTVNTGVSGDLITFSTINNIPIINGFSGYQANISTPNNIGDGLSIINNQDGTMTTTAGGYSTYGSPSISVVENYAEAETATLCTVSGQASGIYPVFESTVSGYTLASMAQDVYQNTDMSVQHYELQLTVVYNGDTLIDHQNINTYQPAYARWTVGSGRFTIQSASGGTVPSPSVSSNYMLYFTCYDPSTGNKIVFSEGDVVVVTLQYILYTPGTEILHMIDSKYIPISGTNDGTDWTSLTIGNDTYSLASGGSSSAPSNMVTTDTRQEITGLKLFENMVSIFGHGTNELFPYYSYGLDIIKDTDNNKGILAIGACTNNGGFYTNEYLALKQLNNSNMDPTGICLYPVVGSGATKDLGRAANKWGNLYLEGNLSDGTNTATIADLAALITYAKGQGWIS